MTFLEDTNSDFLRRHFLRRHSQVGRPSQGAPSTSLLGLQERLSRGTSQVSGHLAPRVGAGHTCACAWFGGLWGLCPLLSPSRNAAFLRFSVQSPTEPFLGVSSRAHGWMAASWLCWETRGTLSPRT